MADVNTRIHDFYWKGRQEGQEEMLDYMDRLAAHYDSTKVDQQESLGKIISILSNVMQQQLKIQRTR